ncbi:MAG: cysteine desulfurase family protein [Pseudomonadota bacterium]|nr:cysteine desulfurase family protein [Pseudomonadota bacterium]
MASEKIYFDYNATTLIDPLVLEEMANVARDNFGNPSSSHCFGRPAAEIVKRSRQQVATLLRAQAEEICFTSGGTESDNLALKGVVLPYLVQGRKAHVIISAVEHPAVTESCRYLESLGAEITRLPVAEDGTLTAAQVGAAFNDDTVLVSLMLANNETGVVFPLAEIAALTKARGILLHTDAVQALGKVEIDVKVLGVDLLSLSGHKVYAPKGVGALWLRSGVELEPLLHGGGQENGLRCGTENLIGMAGLGVACQLLTAGMVDEGLRVVKLRDRLEVGLAIALDQQLIFHGHRRLRVPNTISLSVPYIDGESLLAHLDLEDIAVSAGSACSSGEHQGSPVLRAMGVSSDLAQGSLRISLGRWSTEAEVDIFIEKFSAIVRRLWSISPLYPKK